MHNPDQLTDEELIKQERFDELFERHFNFAHYSRFKWPYNIAFKILQNEEQERDAVQKALDRAWRALKAGQFDYRSTFKTWFSTIVRNVARTERSKERKHRSREIRKGDLPTTDGDDDEDLLEWLVKQRLVSVDAIATPGGPDITAIKTIEIKKVREALTSLDDKERKAIILIHFRGLSYREAAKILDVVASTVKYQVEQGIKELKRLLQPNAKDASPATPRLPEFQGHHITLEEYEALPEEKKVHYLESARERNAEWLKLAFQELQAAWLMIIDGQVYKHGPSLQKYPLPDQFLEICRKKGRYPFVFLHPVSITVEEASTPWQTTNLPGDQYPALTVHFVGQAAAAVDADLDTGAWEMYVDLDWLQANQVVQVPPGIPRWSSFHLSRTFTYTLLPATIEVMDEGGIRHQHQRQIFAIWNWAQSPFVQINSTRLALIGRGTLLELGCILSLDFRKHTTKIYFGNRIVARIRRMVYGGRRN